MVLKYPSTGFLRQAQDERCGYMPLDGSYSFEFRNQCIDVFHLFTGLANRRLNNGDGGQTRRNINAVIGWRFLIHRLFLRLHDVRQRRITWLVQPQIGGDHRWQVQLGQFAGRHQFRASR